ncbi:MAG: sodium-dependent transporter [Emcibacteraceae bacterium]|nr:sodium-dependent transporter [Emcibacteraceae bacterium]MDG1997226.1 sodium-dependent transporter [Emcibacteraceae bacterium]
MSHVVQEKWSSGTAFLLAAIGSAVGLGNIYRFPYVVGENGGGAFVVLYLGIVIVFGIPLVMTELTIGRRKQLPPISAFTELSKDKKSQPFWKFIGFTSILTPLGILGFYFVIAGWTLNYVYSIITGQLSNLQDGQTQAVFSEMMDSPATLIFWMTLSVAITAFIISRGIKAGLEKAVNILMPMLFFILVSLVIYSCFNGGIKETFEFMFTPDFSKINGKTLLEATGQAFFSLSLGSATMLVYGSYLPKNTSIPKLACGVAFADTFVALIAGFAIFPIIFTNGLPMDSGPNLVFVTLPVIFDQMPFGQVFGILFFLLLAFAAITSTISLFEPAVSNLEERGIFTRRKASLVVGLGLWVLAAISALSMNMLSDVRLLTFNDTVADKNIMDLLEYMSANGMMLFNGLFAAIFIGWIMNRKDVLEELGLGDSILFKFWRAIIKYIVPVVVGYLIIDFLGFGFI